jgi:hypothetical protein
LHIHQLLDQPQVGRGLRDEQSSTPPTQLSILDSFGIPDIISLTFTFRFTYLALTCKW